MSFLCSNYPIQGFTFYDGPVWAKNIWFNGFISTPEYKAGAIGYERLNDFTSSSVSAVKNAKFGFVDGVRYTYLSLPAYNMPVYFCRPSKSQKQEL